jgi:hypothetical protein
LGVLVSLSMVKAAFGTVTLSGLEVTLAAMAVAVLVTKPVVTSPAVTV